MRVLLALHVVLLRMRLLAIRGLLRGVIALRSFLRRRQMQPAHIRVAPWVTVLISRKRPLASSIHICAACALAGFMTGWQYEASNWAPSRTANAVYKNSVVKPAGGEEEPKMAIKGKHPNASIELTQTKPAAPHVVLLNPGTADHQASAQPATSPAPRPAENDVSRPDTSHKKAGDDRLSRARRPTQNYEDLRDYVLRR
jgi:hypothetical protein